MKEDPDDNNTAKLCFEKWAIRRTGLPTIFSIVKRLKCDIYRTVLYHIYCRIQNMTSAFLLINCDFPFSEDVINELGRIPEIVDVYRLHGMYDIIARVKSDTEEELNDVVKIRIRKIDKVKSTITMIIAEGDKLKDKNKI